MHFNHTVVEALAYALPEEVWTSDAIETRLAPLYERLKLPAGRLELMSGIRERRFWPADQRPSESAAQAAKALFEHNAIDPGTIDLLIYAGVCRDRLEPATAAYVHGLLGLGSKTAFLDVSNACLGFLNAMVLAAAQIEAGLVKRVLIVSGENGRPLVEHTLQTLLTGDFNRRSIKPYFANLTIGAGAMAAVVTHESAAAASAPVRLTGAVVRSDSLANQLCEGDTTDASGLAMLTDSESLLEAGVALARSTWEAFCRELNWAAETADHIITHQVGRRHQQALFAALGLAESKDFSTYATLGNIGSVSLPITLAKAIESGVVQRQHKLALLGIGSGLGCLMLAAEALR